MYRTIQEHIGQAQCLWWQPCSDLKDSNLSYLQGGLYIFQLFDYYACSGMTLLLFAILQSVCIGWVYGKKYFQVVQICQSYCWRTRKIHLCYAKSDFCFHRLFKSLPLFLRIAIKMMMKQGQITGLVNNIIKAYEQTLLHFKGPQVKKVERLFNYSLKHTKH